MVPPDMCIYIDGSTRGHPGCIYSPVLNVHSVWLLACGDKVYGRSGDLKRAGNEYERNWMWLKHTWYMCTV